MEENLVTWLLASSGLTAVVGTRIHWGVAPQGSDFPRLVINRISGVRHYNYDEFANVTETRVQIDIWGKTYTSTIAASRALVAALHAMPVPYNTIKKVFIANERSIYEAAGNASENYHRIILDAQIWHTEGV